MKKLTAALGFLVVFIVLSMILPNISVKAAEVTEKKIAIGINDDLDNTDGYLLIKQNATYVPIEFFNKLGVLSKWENLNTFSLTFKDKWIKISLVTKSTEDSLGHKEAFVPYKRDNKFFVPIEYGKFFDFTVSSIQYGPVVRVKDNKALLTDPQFIQKNKNNITSYYSPPAAVKKRIPIYLTFDDGPNTYMDSILNTLKVKKAKATFFMIEPQMRYFPNSVKRLVKEGHYPALHSVSHDKNKLYNGNYNNIAKEMEITRQTLLKLTGVHSMLTRAPYGSKPYMTLPYRNSLVNKGFKMWDWNVDTEDWKFQKTNPQRIVQNCQTGVQRIKGKNTPIVILFHVNKGTASVLPRIIDSLYKQGFECVSYNPKNHFVMNFWGDKRL